MCIINYNQTHSSFIWKQRWIRRWNICPQCRRLGFDPWVRKIPWRREWQPILSWKIPWTEKPHRLQSKGLLRVGHDWVTNSCTLSTYIFSSRLHIMLTKVHIVKAMVFPIVMYGCESWTLKQAEHQRIDVFEYGAGEDSWESLGLQGDPTSPS